MAYVLVLEAIGDDLRDKNRLYQRMARDAGVPAEMRSLIDLHPPAPWVAEVVGPHPKYKMERKFLRPQKDYSQSNATGSRGVRLVYVLREGGIYEINERLSWRRTDRYFARVEGDALVRITEEEALACVR
jgi:hypothetical protein